MKTAADRAVRQPGEHVARIAVMDADGARAALLDLAEQARHAVDEGLAADEADILMMLGLPEQMLAGAEADLEPNCR